MVLHQVGNSISMKVQFNPVEYHSMHNIVDRGSSGPGSRSGQDHRGSGLCQDHRASGSGSRSGHDHRRRNQEEEEEDDESSDDSRSGEKT
jgi:hypothetical protein